MKFGATLIVAASGQGFGGAPTGKPTAIPIVVMVSKFLNNLPYFLIVKNVATSNLLSNHRKVRGPLEVPNTSTRHQELEEFLKIYLRK